MGRVVIPAPGAFHIHIEQTPRQVFRLLSQNLHCALLPKRFYLSLLLSRAGCTDAPQSKPKYYCLLSTTLLPLGSTLHKALCDTLFPPTATSALLCLTHGCITLQIHSFLRPVNSRTITSYSVAQAAPRSTQLASAHSSSDTVSQLIQHDVEAGSRHLGVCFLLHV